MTPSGVHTKRFDNTTDSMVLVKTGQYPKSRALRASVQKSEAGRHNKSEPYKECSKSKAACGKEQIVSVRSRHSAFIIVFMHYVFLRCLGELHFGVDNVPWWQTAKGPKRPAGKGRSGPIRVRGSWAGGSTRSGNLSLRRHQLFRLKEGPPWRRSGPR
jgi:hypothetical protein